MIKEALIRVVINERIEHARKFKYHTKKLWIDKSIKGKQFCMAHKIAVRN